ncbi:MAG: DEAD/DEAH box helicase family protein [Deltaproteobacteria bacterium]|nr:DEAD/DEAH box helicase family protein [Deltaproteobacteria bacterium]
MRTNKLSRAGTDRTASTFFREWELTDCRRGEGKKNPAPHQKAALKKLHDWYDKLPAGGPGGILALPTGAGKTFTAIHFLCRGPLSHDYKVLWLAHTHHLLEQAFFSFDAGALGGIAEPRRKLRLRVVSGTPGHFPPRDIAASDDVVIATLQTITNAHREELPQLERFIVSANGKLFVVFDEAHHAPAPSYRKLLQGLREKGAPVLGLTATPTYSDEAKRGWLKRLFPQGILAQARVPELMAQGILAQPHFERASTSIVPKFDEREYEKWIGTYRDIPEDVIDQLAENAERNAFIANTYADKRTKWGKTIIFTDRWFQCEAIVEGLRKRGVKAGAVYSHVDARPASVEGRRRRTQDENSNALERFRRSEIDVLVNVRMLTEGTDLPDAQTVFLTRQTTSQILLTQMIGRALRGPKFGGTPDAFIVSFVDDWQQAIRWAEHDPLVEGRADESEERSFKRPPLLLISIELVKRLVRQLDTGVNVTPGPFVSQMPIGWYRVTFDACTQGTDEVESRDQLVMVFDDEKAGFDKLIRVFLKALPKAFDSESVTLDAQQDALEAWREQHFADASRAQGDLHRDIFDIARHIGQGHNAPEFFPFEVRKDHDLDVLAKKFIRDDLGPRAIDAALQAEFGRENRFWRTLYPRFDLFRSQYYGCQARLLGGSSAPVPMPRSSEVPSASEPDEDVKEQVKGRDGDRCLACGTTRKLQVDHVVPVSVGGPNEPENLQTLCGQCNRAKGKRRIGFRTRRTTLEKPVPHLAQFDVPPGEHAGDRTYWKRFFRRTLNFTYECGAVAEARIAGRGDGYYHWEVELMDGNPPGWLEPFLPKLVERIQEACERAGRPPIESLTITAPGEEPAEWPSKRRPKGASKARRA